MEEFNFVVVEVQNFENLAKRMNVALLEISDCQKSHARNTDQHFLQRKFLYKYRVLNADHN